MRLIYVLLSPTFGMHQYTADLANRMRSHYDVHLITTVDYPSDRYAPGIRVHTPVRFHNTGLSAESFRYWQIGSVYSAIERLSPAIVHITGPHLWNVPLVRWIKKRNLPAIHSIHDLDPHEGTRLGKLLMMWNAAIIRSVDHILVHGARYRKRLTGNGFAEDKVTFTPLTHLFMGYSKSLEVPLVAEQINYEPVILFFGRIEKYKGVEILLEAYSNLRNTNKWSNQPAPRLVLAGPGQIPDKLLDLAPLGVEWRNRLIPDDEALDLFQRCSVVILPYIDGTQSSIVSAAYFFNKPVVVTRVGALPEYVIEDETGLLVEPGDSYSLSSAMLSILTDPGYQRTMGVAGRRWYDFEREKETRSLRGLYDRMFARLASD